MTTDRCETCGDPATQWDYDQLMHFCDRHVQQADFTVPLEDRCAAPHPVFDGETCVLPKGHAGDHRDSHDGGWRQDK